MGFIGAFLGYMSYLALLTHHVTLILSFHSRLRHFFQSSSERGNRRNFVGFKEIALVYAPSCILMTSLASLLIMQIVSDIRIQTTELYF